MIFKFNSLQNLYGLCSLILESVSRFMHILFSCHIAQIDIRTSFQFPTIAILFYSDSPLVVLPLSSGHNGKCLGTVADCKKGRAELDWCLSKDVGNSVMAVI